MAFRPLILRESKREAVYNALGEDAVSIGWEIFLRFIRRYNGADYANLPGLIRYHLHYELLHAVQRQGALWDSEELCSMDEGTAAASVAAEDAIGRFIFDNALARGMERLTEKQRMVLQHIYYEDGNVLQASKLLSCSHVNVIRHHNRACDNIKHFLT